MASGVRCKKTPKRMRLNVWLKGQKPEIAEGAHSARGVVNKVLKSVNAAVSKSVQGSRNGDHNGTSCNHPKISSSVSFWIPTK